MRRRLSKEKEPVSNFRKALGILQKSMQSSMFGKRATVARDPRSLDKDAWDQDWKRNRYHTTTRHGAYEIRPEPVIVDQPWKRGIAEIGDPVSHHVNYQKRGSRSWTRIGTGIDAQDARKVAREHHEERVGKDLSIDTD